MNYLDTVSDWLWNDRFWLPPGISFKDLQDKPGFHYAKPRELLNMLVFAVCIFCVRKVFEVIIGNPLAHRMGIVDKRKKPSDNKQLEEAYKLKKQPNSSEIDDLAKSAGLSRREVTTWFRRRRNMDRPSLHRKFSEACWRCFFYTFVFLFGMSMLVQAPWFWDNLYCWVDYPRQSLWPSVYYYYMLEGGFYLSLLLSLVSDVKRKDFNEQIIHHFSTIFLIGFSYVANFVRVGTLVMAIHDISDVFLEVAKCFVYAKKKEVANHIFNIFAAVFILSRIFAFPYVILHTTWVKSMWLFRPYPGYYFFNALLLILQLLHIFWASTIIKMAVILIRDGAVKKDERSDVEELTSDEDEDNSKKEK